MDDPRSDQELIQAINAGGPAAHAAFEALYLRYRDWVVGLAYRCTGSRDEALDVMQETFMYLLRKFPGFELTASLKTFLYPAVQHLAIASRRKTRRFASDEAALASRPAPTGPHDASPQAAAASDLSGVLDGLPEGQRQVILLRFVDGLSLQEVAGVLGVPVGTVKSRLHNALNALRDGPRTKEYFAP